MRFLLLMYVSSLSPTLLYSCITTFFLVRDSPFFTYYHYSCFEFTLNASGVTTTFFKHRFSQKFKLHAFQGFIRPNNALPFLSPPWSCPCPSPSPQARTRALHCLNLAHHIHKRSKGRKEKRKNSQPSSFLLLFLLRVYFLSLIFIEIRVHFLI